MADREGAGLVVLRDATRGEAGEGAEKTAAKPKEKDGYEVILRPSGKAVSPKEREESLENVTRVLVDALRAP